MPPRSEPFVCGTTASFVRIPARAGFRSRASNTSIDPPGFVWYARIRMLPLLWIEARDCLISGHGNMLVKFNSIFTLADAHGAGIDQGSQARHEARRPPEATHH